MTVKQIFKQFIPPILLVVYQNYKNGYLGYYIWKGMYKSYKDVPVKGKSYNEKIVASETAGYTKSLVDELKTQRQIPYHVNGENTFLPLLATMVLEKNKKLNVLDLGGGMGVGFISLLSCVGEIKNLNYFIIETPAMCEFGTQIFQADNRVQFLTDFPDKLNDIDVVYINSSLQYFENYADILNRLAGYKPEYFLFIKFSAGEIPTYATEQINLRNTTCAYWFFSVDEIVACMQGLGYSLKYKSALDRIYNQDNFPQEYRVGKACNLLFSRVSNP
jgi:putative methyltransferase (TIGR04325 family)